jgi:hypothetical protein
MRLNTCPTFYIRLALKGGDCLDPQRGKIIIAVDEDIDARDSRFGHLGSLLSHATTRIFWFFPANPPASLSE